MTMHSRRAALIERIGPCALETGTGQWKNTNHRAAGAVVMACRIITRPPGLATANLSIAGATSRTVTIEIDPKLDKIARADNTLCVRQLNSRFLIESGRGSGPMTPQQPAKRFARKRASRRAEVLTPP